MLPRGIPTRERASNPRLRPHHLIHRSETESDWVSQSVSKAVPYFAIYNLCCIILKLIQYDMKYLLTAIGLTPSGSSTVHIDTQTIYRATQLTPSGSSTAHIDTQTIHRATQLTPSGSSTVHIDTQTIHRATQLTPSGSSTVHIDTQTIHRATQLTTFVGRLPGIRTQSGQTKINDKLTAKKLSPNCEELLLLSSVSPLCRVSTLIFLRQTMSLGNTELRLFWCYYSWCSYR